MSTPCTVSLPNFEGPLDLLLHLIKRNEMQVTDIPIATITDQYLATLEAIPALNLDGAGEYLVMAATLIYIKSRMLLPGVEDDEPEEDPRSELVQQLVEYQRFREVAIALGDRSVLARDVFAAPGEPVAATGAEEAPPPVRDANLGDLLAALRDVLARLRPPRDHEIQREGLSVRDGVHGILAELARAAGVEFMQLFPPGATPEAVIVTFLALLELIRLGVVRARQAVRFGPITLELAVDTLEEAERRVQDLGQVDEWRGGEANHGDGTTSDR